MRKTIISFMAAAVLTGAVAVAPAQAVHVHVNIGVPGVLFEAEPAPVLVPNTHVYYVQQNDWDVYRYGGWWYAYRDGYWYRAHTYRGPFAPVVYESVPRSILVVPNEYHRYEFRHVGHGPEHSHREHGHGHWEHHVEQHGGGHYHGAGEHHGGGHHHGH